jgi:hypothetical protein
MIAISPGSRDFACQTLSNSWAAGLRVACYRHCAEPADNERCGSDPRSATGIEPGYAAILPGNPILQIHYGNEFLSGYGATVSGMGR